MRWKYSKELAKLLFLITGEPSMAKIGEVSFLLVGPFLLNGLLF